jgi:gliding motility-associated transport system ATP-binding protein
MIEVEQLSKTYGPIKAIEDVSFVVEKGEILGFLGPNGAGKSTTMRILTCFMPPTSGTARIAGFDIFKDSLQVRRRIGYVPENAPLYTDMPVVSFLKFVGEMKGLSRRERLRQIGQVMEDCGIKDVQHRYIGKLSKGYRQRVALAQALLGNPEVLILDEPTIGLDPRQIIEIRQLIKGLAGQKTVILSTHILPEVGMTCQRVIIINRGRLVAVDTPENLTTKLQTSSRLLVRVEGPATEVMRALGGVSGVQTVKEDGVGAVNLVTCIVESRKDRDVRKDIAAAVVRQNWGLLELRPVDLTLEDVFVRLVTEEKESTT